ncbi:histidine kinase [Kitasatospora phosalacinea]|uniref:histidine kinase n=1 Tax=Kitasatospora phosalacinea TaxID=2065 RepID=A0A9W6UXU2_9ACTN|nr:sensor histidine kinase [Kitasatospora phosalacinea]GLW67714.1 histidine kinase [Kitasatospora phosalacinea]
MRTEPRPSTAWQAMARRPWAFLASGWPWRAAAYLLSGVLVGAAAVLVLVAGLVAGLVLLVVLVGVAPLAGVVLAATAVAAVERWRLRLVDDDPAPDPHRPPSGPGPRAWVASRLTERATWRELGFTLVSACALWWLDVLVLAFAFGLPALCFAATDGSTWPWTVFGALVLLASPWTVTSWAGARAALARTLLAPRDEELGAQLQEVRAARSRLLDAFDAERVRIERDLHDGAQQHLVALGLTLGLLDLDLPADSPARPQLARAQRQLGDAHRELRDLLRGLNPPVLADHGLAAAVRERAGRLPLPVAVDLDLPGRLPPQLETHLYYLVSEALTNVARHSGASRAAVHGRYRADLLVLEITDDGAGGADPALGTGLTGLADRLAAVDGRLRVSSPPGGPTLLHVEVPCHFG